MNEACTSVGVAKYGRPIGLDEKIKVDLIIIGSVAVDPTTGARLGKGEVIIINKLLLNSYAFITPLIMKKATYFDFLGHIWYIYGVGDTIFILFYTH